MRKTDIKKLMLLLLVNGIKKESNLYIIINFEILMSILLIGQIPSFMILDLKDLTYFDNITTNCQYNFLRI